MKYREIIEEQIKALQERQRDRLTNTPEEACEIAETIANLALQLSQEFIPEDSIHGKCKDTIPCKCPEKEVAPEGQVQKQLEFNAKIGISNLNEFSTLVDEITDKLNQLKNFKFDIKFER